MSRAPRSRAALVVALLVAATALSGCNTFRRLAELGEDPPLSPVQSPKERSDFRQVSMPMPPPITADRKANSLWRPGARAFFRDQRASQVGDIVTININRQESADITNTTTLTRNNTEGMAMPNLLGLTDGGATTAAGTELRGWVPNALNPQTTVDVTGTKNNRNGGTISREEEVRVKVAAVITQILPNGNMVLYGKQEMRVNQEVRELAVSGVIRPEDINSSNEVNIERMAEARVSYGGRGAISDIQQPRYGSQILDIILPF